jgi:hypothetical protein
MDADASIGQYLPVASVEISISRAQFHEKERRDEQARFIGGHG